MRVSARDCWYPDRPIKSHLVTHRWARPPLSQRFQRPADTSSLVTLSPGISPWDKEIGCFSSLVTTRLEWASAMVLVDDPDEQHARPEHERRAADHGSSPGSRVSATSAVGWLSYWLRDRPAPGSTSALAFGDRSGITFGSLSIDDVCSFSRAQGSSWVSMTELPPRPDTSIGRKTLEAFQQLFTIPACHREHDSASLKS
jgi:hypothetical protein